MRFARLFQEPHNVANARKRLASIQSDRSKGSTVAKPDPLSSIKSLLRVAENQSIATSVRSKAVESARTSYSEILLEHALDNGNLAGQFDELAIRKLNEEIERAENQCVQSLYAEAKTKIDKWLSSSMNTSKQVNNVSSEDAPVLSKQIASQLSEGIDHLQELMPFAKADSDDARHFYGLVEKQVKQLQRQKAWIYNKQVLSLVREVESEKKWSAEDKLRNLAEVSEELLTPYVLRRHNELWDKVFAELGDEDKKVEATRLRVLRVNE